MTRLPAQETIYLPELLKLVNNATDKDNQKELLNLYYNKDELHNKTLVTLVQLLLHPDIVWGLPEGHPPYTAATPHIGQAPVSLFGAFKQISRLLVGGGNYLQNPTRREMYYLQTLESLSTEEAELLCQIKDKKLISYPNISLSLFAELFPDLLPESVVASLEAEQTKKPIMPVETGLVDSPTIVVKPVAKKSGRPKKSTT